MVIKLRALMAASVALLFVGLPAVHAGTEKAPKTIKEKVSYGLGVEMAEKLRSQGIQTDMDLVIQGFKDGTTGAKLSVPADELRMVLGALRHELMVRKMNAAEQARKAGEEFLASNKTKEGVVSLPDGLQYKILKAGDGEKPKEDDTVVCNFKGTLIDGTELDKSAPGKPAAFKVDGVIPGWKEALQLMPVGSKWQIFIPSQLAYGEKGGDERIGPNSALIFELELVGINKDPAPRKEGSHRPKMTALQRGHP